MAAQAQYIEESANVKLNEEPEDETTEPPHGTQMSLVTIFLLKY